MSISVLEKGFRTCSNPTLDRQAPSRCMASSLLLLECLTDLYRLVDGAGAVSSHMLLLQSSSEKKCRSSLPKMALFS